MLIPGLGGFSLQNVTDAMREVNVDEETIAVIVSAMERGAGDYQRCESNLQDLPTSAAGASVAGEGFAQHASLARAVMAEGFAHTSTNLTEGRASVVQYQRDMTGADEDSEAQMRLVSRQRDVVDLENSARREVPEEAQS